MDNWRDWFDWLTIGEWAASGISWFISTFAVVLDILREFLLTVFNGLADILIVPPWWLVVVVGGLLGWYVINRLLRSGPPGWAIGLGVAGGLLALDVGLWFVQESTNIALVDTYGGPYSLIDFNRPSFMLLFMPPSWVMILMLAALAWVAHGWKLALGSAVALLLIDVMTQWENTMITLAMVIVACGVATLLAVPIGIIAARSRIASSIVKPVLDFMQTMPALIYVLIAVIIFGVGVVPGIIATVVFAMPPGIRLTELGIRQVDAEVVEAGHAFGSPPGNILRQIQLPLALPTIMAGINQVIMLSLSMVVLAGFVGGPGLGREVLAAISRFNIGLGIEAGLSVVILAIFLDRVTAALGARSTVARLEQAA